ncbi:hypothetical protein D3C87_1430000 [compost metagenome]
MGLFTSSISDFHTSRCFSRLCRSWTCTISPASSMALYQASCPCVCAQAWAGECQPRKLFPGATKRAIWVATTKPILPLLSSGNETTAFARSGLSVSPVSLLLMEETRNVRSRFHSNAFILKSKWASTANIRYILIFLFLEMIVHSPSILYLLTVAALSYKATVGQM